MMGANVKDFVTFLQEAPNCTTNAVVKTTSPLQAESLATTPTVCPVLRSNIAHIGLKTQEGKLMLLDAIASLQSGILAPVYCIIDCN